MSTDWAVKTLANQPAVRLLCHTKGLNVSGQRQHRLLHVLVELLVIYLKHLPQN